VLPGILAALVILGQIGGEDTPAPVTAKPATSPPPTEAAAPATQPAAPTNKAAAPTSRAAASTKAPEPTKPEVACIGDAVQAGDWTFKISKVKCGASKVENEFLNKKAQGQFCLVSLTAKNNGETAGTLMGSNQKLLDKDGREFSSDDEASIYEAGGNSSLFVEEINPGNTAKGVIVFDIPEDARPVQAKLAGGFFGIKDVATVDLT
jgi:hypothetical protein